MHRSAQEHMALSVRLYLKKDRHYQVLDFGSRSDGGDAFTHRAMLADYDCTVTGVDVVDGPNVDVVMRKPYRIPLKSNTQDVIVTGQVYEHIPFFWVSFLEMCRVLAPGGLIFLTAPSRGHAHAAFDPWRYYPDAMRALAAYGRVKLREAHTDMPPKQPNSRRFDYPGIDSANRYWGDTVGVFQKPQRYSRAIILPRELSVWWANRVGGLEHIPRTAPRPRRVKLAARRF